MVVTFAEWLRIVDTTLKQRGRGFGVEDIHEGTLRDAFARRIAPVDFALHPNIPLKNGVLIQPRAPSFPTTQYNQTGGLEKAGWWMMGISFVFLVYFLIFYDTSVPTMDGERVNNIGRMNDRGVWVIVSGVVLIAGAIFVAVSKLRD